MITVDLFSDIDDEPSIYKNIMYMFEPVIKMALNKIVYKVIFELNSNAHKLDLDTFGFDYHNDGIGQLNSDLSLYKCICHLCD